MSYAGSVSVIALIAWTTLTFASSDGAPLLPGALPLEEPCSDGRDYGCPSDDGACGPVDPLAGLCGEAPAQPGSPAAGLGAAEGSCGDRQCELPPGLEAAGPACCTPSGDCGISSLSLPPDLNQCVRLEQVDADCPGLCCTAEGYCGFVSAGGVCRVRPSLGEVSDCDGELLAFACAGAACPLPAGVPFHSAQCCTESGACGLAFGTRCLPADLVDATCPAPTSVSSFARSGSVPGCRDAAGRCGAFDAVTHACRAAP
jgi:hypothetical protein